MTENDETKGWRRLGPMVAAAAIAHVALMLVTVPGRQGPERAALELQWIELASPAAPAPAPLEPQVPEAEHPPESEPAPEPAASLPSAVAASAPPPEPEQPSEAGASPPSAQRLRELALIAGRAQSERSAPSRSVIEGFAVPRLPSEAGWLNDHVGTVPFHADTWLEADGGRSSRVVTTSGDAYCGRARAATAAEEFNPWMSAVVMTWRPCGRQRPEPVDRSNPWLRGTGATED